MSDQQTPPPVTTSGAVRTWLIAGVIGLVAAIVFGLIWIFVVAPTLPTGNLGWFLFSFATGLTMIVLPCTLPLAFVIVPLAMGRGMAKGLLMALSFGAGVALMLSLYGVIAAVVGGAAVDALGAPLESVKNWVYFIAGIFALVFALSEIGLLKVRMPSYSGAAPAFIQKRGDLLKAFLLGMFLGNIGVGCPHPATPLLLIEIASSGDILYGWFLFLVHAIGRILPLLLLAFLGILGVNGLTWLVARRERVEKATGWAMVFVAGFILTLGLFTHDWWVNSGIHTQFEKVTQEERFIGILVTQLDSEVTHRHGIEEGPGLFGLPLALGNWFLVTVWLVPIWWWWFRKRRRLFGSPSFVLRKIEEEIDLLEKKRREVEGVIKLDEVATETDLAALLSQADALEKERRAAEEAVHYTEKGTLESPLARDYEQKALAHWRNFFIVLSLLLGLVFIYLLPHNFLKHEALEIDVHGANERGATDIGTLDTPAFNAETFSRDTAGLPDAQSPRVVVLRDGDVYDITATLVKKEVGNRVLKMLAYNGSVPGPIIRVPQGAEVTIRLTNKTDIETTVHHHGVRIDNRFDGVPYVTQDPIEVGDTFVYTVRFPDAGTYWYHPHIREDYSQEHGLYGNYIVEPSASGYWSPVNREVPLVIDDILLNTDGIDYFYKDFVNYALLGRFGNHFLVNGEEEPVITVASGEVIRFLVTNVSNTRTYKLSVPGAALKRVGADVGKYEREEYVDDFLISPAERVIVEVYFEKQGLYRLRHTQPDGTHDVAFFNVTDKRVGISYADAFNTLRRNADVIAEIDEFRPHFERPVDKRLALGVLLGDAEVDHSVHAHDAGGGGDDAADAHAHGDETADGNAHGGGSAVDHLQHAHTAGGSGEALIQWDDPAHSDRTNTTPPITHFITDRDTGATNMDINWTFRVGDVAKVSIWNDPDADHVMQHPIHFHGQRFLILSRDGVPEANKVWKDTVLVLPGETVTVLVEMSNPGEWMAHCHIAEHLHAGMMFGFRVVDESGDARGDAYREGLVERGILHHLHPFWQGGLEAVMRATGMDSETDHIHDDTHPHDGGSAQESGVHVHEDGAEHFHAPASTGVWWQSSAWWWKFVVSLVLMILLSLGVRRYLRGAEL